MSRRIEAIVAVVLASGLIVPGSMSLEASDATRLPDGTVRRPAPGAALPVDPGWPAPGLDGPLFVTEVRPYDNDLAVAAGADVTVRFCFSRATRSRRAW